MYRWNGGILERISDDMQTFFRVKWNVRFLRFTIDDCRKRRMLLWRIYSLVWSSARISVERISKLVHSQLLFVMDMWKRIFLPSIVPTCNSKTRKMSNKENVIEEVEGICDGIARLMVKHLTCFSVFYTMTCCSNQTCDCCNFSFTKTLHSIQRTAHVCYFWIGFACPYLFRDFSWNHIWSLKNASLGTAQRMH